jgi:hypothetical protein
MLYLNISKDAPRSLSSEIHNQLLFMDEEVEAV